MKSIRRSLLLNVFVLLAVALAAICAVVYHTTEQNLTAKQHDTERLIRLQFEEARDEALANQALSLARLAHSQLEPDRFRPMLSPYTLLAAADRARSRTPVNVVTAVWSAALVGMGPVPGGDVALPIWLGERRQSWPLAYWLGLQLATDVRLDEELLSRDPQTAAHEYLQINGAWGSVWRSHSLGESSLAMDSARFASKPDFDKHFDDVEIAPGILARRVQVKAPLTRFRAPWQPPPPPRYEPHATARAGIASALSLALENPRGRRGGPPSGVLTSSRTVEQPSESRSVLERSFPDIYVQVAWSTSPSHPVIKDLADRRDNQLRDVEQETATTLRDLRKRLTWIGVITLAAVLVGGWLLVGFGLMPLRRLSHAVSQVSAKDFHLPIERKELPSEAMLLVDRLTQTLGLLHNAFEREKRAASDISHELRTPVAALMTTLEVALRKPRSPDQYRETLEDCRSIGKELSHLVERVLTLARLDAGTDLVRPRMVELDPIVAGCAAIGRPLAESQGVRLRTSAEEQLIITTDPDKVREVLMNLMHNAIEYNRPGGEVEVSARRRENGGVVLVVRDTGIGIPADIQDKIFERFFRGDPSRNGTGVHAGLGLAIVKEYVDRLGGKLTVQSAVGEGSLFRIELPDLNPS